MKDGQTDQWTEIKDLKTDQNISSQKIVTMLPKEFTGEMIDFLKKSVKTGG